VSTLRTPAAPQHRTAPQPAAAALDYCFGAAGDEATMTRNEAMLDRAVLVPRVLAGAPADPSVEITGGTIAAPVVIAPMGLQGLLDPRAETVAARAAAEADLGFCLSTFSSASAADVAATPPGLRWRQVYLTREPQLTRYLVEEAEQLGFRAIVVTLDVPVVGRRSRDVANGMDRFAVAPPALVRAEPFRRLLAQRGGEPRDVLADVFPNPYTSWADVAELISATRLPVLLKGIMHPEDARRAREIGAAGLVVSNHGGRQFDRSISSLEALPAVVAAAEGSVPVYLDSGIRRPAHVAVALSLGARAVLLGRPVLTALATGRPDAVVTLLRHFTEEFAQTMTLLGARRPSDLLACAPQAGSGGEIADGGGSA
jgi:isopentenyl diphosphate isomerase/L-lactate dehydrogenase-like FMN-dependent dehydrogenase